MGKKVGSSTGSIEMSPNKAKRLAKKRREEEKLWRSKNGPVIVTKIAEKKDLPES